MAITTNPADKYAFLFSGPTTERFLKDLENVAETLVEYYNYPPSQIKVVLGSTPTPMPAFSGASVAIISNATELANELSSFATMAAGTDRTALLYVTGGGIAPPAGTTDSQLIITGGLTPPSVNSAWLTPRLNALSPAHVNVVMQQPYAGGFETALTASTLAEWSFTYACTAHEESYGDSPVVKGSFFTHAWTRALKLEALPAGTPDVGQYADELGAGSEHTNRLVSLQEAMAFAKQIHDYVDLMAAFSTPGYAGPLAGGSQFLGKPEFLIRDGSPWWESPDIYLTHPNHAWVPAGDLYIPDLPGAIAPFNNTINIDVRNVGTHPVRLYSLGIELFKTGAGATNEDLTACDIAPAAGVMLPMDLADIGGGGDKKETYPWNTAFYVGLTHECVKAEAELLCSEVDFAWDPQAFDNEAQRNTDEMMVVPPPPPPLPFPGIQGFKEHVYGLKNRFETPRKFLVVFPENFEHQDVIELDWFGIIPDPKSEPNPLEVVHEPVPHLPFALKAGEERDILLRARLKPDAGFEGELKLPFEVWAEGDWPDDARPLAQAVQVPNFAPIAGFTVTIKTGSTTLKGTVLNAETKPATGAKVLLRTVDDRQGAVLETDEKGNYAFPDINPDVYILWAESGTWRSKEQTVVLFSDQEEKVELSLDERIPEGESRVKVILDKIRILSDQDPCLKGKGELTFTAVVVPDSDDSRKQVTRLPATGVYHVADKPGENDIELRVTVFDGVVKNRQLAIGITGKEIDTFDRDDVLNRYHRSFAGDPGTWYGEYYPSDEYLDREDVGEWAVWYRIVRA